MKSKYNRFALLPVHCPHCHNFIWLEPYRRAEIYSLVKGFYKSNICKDCIAKFDVKERANE